MTDIQIMTLATAILVPLSLLLLSDSRVGDAKVTLRADMRADRAEINSRFERFETQTNARFDRLEAKIDKIGDTLSQILADHEQRISRLEDRR